MQHDYPGGMQCRRKAPKLIVDDFLAAAEAFGAATRPITARRAKGKGQTGQFGSPLLCIANKKLI
jgi:hypothetical protein